MLSKLRIQAQRTRRRGHVRRTTRGTTERPRLSVFRSGKHISAQVIDDGKGVTIVAASTLEKAIRDGLKSTANKEAAERVGQKLAELAKAAGVTQVKFDRGHYKYHGRIKALAEAARKAGLSF